MNQIPNTDRELVEKTEEQIVTPDFLAALAKDGLELVVTIETTAEVIDVTDFSSGRPIRTRGLTKERIDGCHVRPQTVPFTGGK